MITKNIGGDRVGSGGKMNVHLKGFERSTHDLSSIWRSTMSPGTLIPFMVEYGLNGDTWDINLNTLIRTLPTNAPVLGSFKLQLDVFQIPLRLYIKDLRNNKLDVGMKMDNIQLPKIEFMYNQDAEVGYYETMNNSSLNAYLGIRGIPVDLSGAGNAVYEFNAIAHYAYYDIFKNYYANKQEENAYVIGKNSTKVQYIDYILGKSTAGSVLFTLTSPVESSTSTKNWTNTDYFDLVFKDNIANELTDDDIEYYNGTNWVALPTLGAKILEIYNPKAIKVSKGSIPVATFRTFRVKPGAGEPLRLKSFPLTNIDTLITKITTTNDGIHSGQLEPAISAIDERFQTNGGILVKTYQSDLFNNWVNTDWIDGVGGVNDIASVTVSNGKFSIDQFNLASKVYDLLNRVAVSGGSYEDWQEAVWGDKVQRQYQTPIYMGGASTEIVFNEVVSTASTQDQVLGDLAGKGTTNGNLKGGYINIKINEPSLIMGIVSITPRLDYSQGNKWFTNLKTMNDFHKPSLDGIGFQELITEQMAFWSTQVYDNGMTVERMSAGKQPAWINYMTAFNETFGEFADEDKFMYVTLNRRYEKEYNPDSSISIKDLTTYIDPSKYNYIFNYTKIDSQNFWVQIAKDITTRRKMSAKIIPNL